MDQQQETVCPYCAERVRNSRDHIFPEFLGGTKTIGACKRCNDTFGHSSEGPVCRDLAPFAVLLRKSRIKAPRYSVWRKAVVHEGIEWDLDSELVMRPSRAHLENVDGVQRGIFPVLRSAKRWAADVLRMGRKIKLESRSGPPIQMNTTRFNLNVGTELRRVAQKMCVALTDHLGIRSAVLDQLGRKFLLARAESGDRIRIDWQVHPTLEALRSPLSHLVFVKGNSQTHRCYGVVQFYGALQLHVILNDTEYQGDSFAVFGRLDPVSSYREDVGVTDLLLIPEAPSQLNSAVAQTLRRQWLTKLVNECKAASGKMTLASQSN